MTRIATSIATGVLSLALASMCGLATAQNAPAKVPAPIRAQPNMADATFAAWDADRNGTLSQHEFRTGWQRTQQAVQAQARLRQQFETLDVNKSRAIEAAEYGNLLLIKEAGKSAPPMSTFDSDKNKALDFKEYVGMVDAMMKNRPRP